MTTQTCFQYLEFVGRIDVGEESIKSYDRVGKLMKETPCHLPIKSEKSLEVNSNTSLVSEQTPIIFTPTSTPSLPSCTLCSSRRRPPCFMLVDGNVTPYSDFPSPTSTLDSFFLSSFSSSSLSDCCKEKEKEAESIDQSIIHKSMCTHLIQFDEHDSTISTAPVHLPHQIIGEKLSSTGSSSISSSVCGNKQSDKDYNANKLFPVLQSAKKPETLFSPFSSSNSVTSSLSSDSDKFNSNLVSGFNSNSVYGLSKRLRSRILPDDDAAMLYSSPYTSASSTHHGWGRSQSLGVLDDLDACGGVEVGVGVSAKVQVKEGVEIDNVIVYSAQYGREKEMEMMMIPSVEILNSPFFYSSQTHTESDTAPAAADTTLLPTPATPLTAPVVASTHLDLASTGLTTRLHDTRPCGSSNAAPVPPNTAKILSVMGSANMGPAECVSSPLLRGEENVWESRGIDRQHSTPYAQAHTHIHPHTTYIPVHTPPLPPPHTHLHNPPHTPMYASLHAGLSFPPPMPDGAVEDMSVSPYVPVSPSSSLCVSPLRTFSPLPPSSFPLPDGAVPVFTAGVLSLSRCPSSGLGTCSACSSASTPHSHLFTCSRASSYSSFSTVSSSSTTTSSSFSSSSPSLLSSSLSSSSCLPVSVPLVPVPCPQPHVPRQPSHFAGSARDGASTVDRGVGGGHCGQGVRIRIPSPSPRLPVPVPVAAAVAVAVALEGCGGHGGSTENGSNSGMGKQREEEEEGKAKEEMGEIEGEGKEGEEEANNMLICME